MNIDDLEELSLMCKSVYTIEALKDAIEKDYWIKISTPYCDAGQIGGGELSHILDRHLKKAVEEMEQYLECIEIKGLWDGE